MPFLARIACWLSVIAGCSLDLTIPDLNTPGDAPRDLSQLELSADIPDAPRDRPALDAPVGPVTVVGSWTTTAKCPVTHPVLLGGGGECPTQHQSSRAATGEASWEVGCTAGATGVAPRTYAICGTAALFSNLPQAATSGCSPGFGEVIAGGGACTPNERLLSLAPLASNVDQPPSSPAPGSAWGYTCSGAAGKQLEAGGKCLKDTRVVVVENSPTDPGTRPAEVGVTVSCPAGDLVVSGGCFPAALTSMASYIALVGSFPDVVSSTPPRAWMCRFRTTVFPVTYFAYAVCWTPP